MTRNAIRTAFGAALLSILALPAVAGGGGLQKPVTLVDVPQLTQCRGLLTQALLDRVLNATEDPGETFEKMRRARPNMMERPPLHPCYSNVGEFINTPSATFYATPQATTARTLPSPPP